MFIVKTLIKNNEVRFRKLTFSFCYTTIPFQRFSGPNYAKLVCANPFTNRFSGKNMTTMEPNQHHVINIVMNKYSRIFV